MRQLGLDAYATLDSPLHRWDVRAKLVGLLVLIFAFAAVRDVRLLPAMFLVTAMLFALSRLPLSYLLTRLRLPGLFIAFLVILLPFIAGETVLARLGPLTLRQEGLADALAIAARFVCIITLTLVLFGTAPFLRSIKALRSLGLPDILADMVLLTYRYLFEMAEMFSTMRTAVRLRGFRGDKLNRRNLSTLASLIGSLLVRSYEQAEQVYNAMILRGYGANAAVLNEFHTTRRDVALSVLCVVVALAFVAGQWWLGRVGA